MNDGKLRELIDSHGSPASGLKDERSLSPAQEKPGPPPRRGMVWLAGGTFRMGSDDHYPEEAPTREASVEGFWIDVKPVTNREFGRFVAATGWVTLAQRGADAQDFPDAPPDRLRAAPPLFRP